MNKELNRLHKISEIVLKVLREDSLSRDDDKRLYLIVCEMIALSAGTNVENISLAEVMTSTIYPMPETVRRARQKIQAIFPDLGGARRPERMARQEVFKEFAKEKGIA